MAQTLHSTVMKGIFKYFIDITALTSHCTAQLCHEFQMFYNHHGSSTVMVYHSPFHTHIKTVLSRFRNIPIPTSKSGRPNSTLRSRRPGLIRAGSKVSGLKSEKEIL